MRKNQKNKKVVKKVVRSTRSAANQITFFEFIKLLLRGFSQVMLQENIWTGLLFLIGIFWNSWVMALGAIIGVLAGNLTAFVLKYKFDDIKKGFYGFNAVLVGIAVLFFFKFTLAAVIFIILGSALSSIIMNFMHKNHWNPLTFPFVLTAWILIFVIKLFNLVPAQPSGILNSVSLNFASATAMSFGQVMFQASIVTGIIFFIAIFINSRIVAAYALGGAIIGALVAFMLSFPPTLISMGIFGFNGVLCGIAFADLKWSSKKWQSIIWALIAVVLSVFIIFGMNAYGLVALTFPFVLATWITLLIKKYISH